MPVAAVLSQMDTEQAEKKLLLQQIGEEHAGSELARQLPKKGALGSPQNGAQGSPHAPRQRCPGVTIERCPGVTFLFNIFIDKEEPSLIIRSTI